MAHLLEARDLVKVFPGIRAVDGISFSVGLLIAARLRAEELADGVLNILSWPMLLLSGVWFSMEGTNPTARFVSSLLPLTHLVDAARAVMVYGAGVARVLPEIVLLGGMGLVLLLIAARIFRWD
jgi:ABC-type multidrug transport system permease subunit